MRYITVPKNKNAELAFDYDMAKKSDLFEIELEDKCFSSLWGTDIFKSINVLIGTNIDLYEDESIKDKFLLELVLKSGILERKASLDFHSNEILEKIKTLFKEAIDRDTGIYFHF